MREFRNLDVGAGFIFLGTDYDAMGKAILCIKTDERNMRIFKRIDEKTGKIVFHRPGGVNPDEAVREVFFSVSKDQMWFSEGKGEPYKK